MTESGVALGFDRSEWSWVVWLEKRSEQHAVRPNLFIKEEMKLLQPQPHIDSLIRSPAALGQHDAWKRDELHASLTSCRSESADRDRAAAERDSLPLISGSPVFSTAAYQEPREPLNKTKPLETAARKQEKQKRFPTRDRRGQTCRSRDCGGALEELAGALGYSALSAAPQTFPFEVMLNTD
ncbi:hypothetical protein EYF80_000211 [Liparis tanakae]|uniref:Uncharacterized protein n=1 Tax=Liparis tanakae TaxID=230148 RepID=A0A4Z2JIZ8_9TELE|nr:hypothetical protein EYF80_000211 [Liparis tanakae]